MPSGPERDEPRRRSAPSADWSIFGWSHAAAALSRLRREFGTRAACPALTRHNPFQTRQPGRQRPGHERTCAMGLFSKDIKSMDDLFVHTLQDVYYAENKIVKSLPDMIEEANDPQLKQGLRSHLRETENHVRRLDQVFQMLGQKAKSVDCPA